jgi:hypothetical protein
MKSLLKIFLISAGILIWCSPCFSAYLIEFKTGAKFITANYWEADRHVWFNQSGGLVGVEKHLVKEIRESGFSNPIQETESETHPDPDTGRMAKKSPSAGESKKANIRQNPSGPASIGDTVKNDGIRKTFAGLKQRVTDAPLLEKTELVELAKDMTAFRNRVLAKNLGHIYTDQLLELSGMFDTLEEIITSKNQ